MPAPAKLPKTFSDSLIRKLNDRCAALSTDCGDLCSGIGWCADCWPDFQRSANPCFEHSCLKGDIHADVR